MYVAGNSKCMAVIIHYTPQSIHGYKQKFFLKNK